MATIAIIGAGAWGTALSVHLARQNHEIWLWGHHAENMLALETTRINHRYLPGITLPTNIHCTSDLAHALSVTADHLLAVPSDAFAETITKMRAVQPLTALVWVTKGLESASCEWLPTFVANLEGTQFPIAMLAGPGFALEVAKGLPTAVSLASNNLALCARWQSYLHAANFRVYTSNDVIGVAIAAATKNIFAIAAGISDGFGFGANARAALITRGLAEITRLGLASGGRIETFLGLAGVGDLVLTCTDNQSRNRRFGLALGQGASLENAFASINQVVEGYHTTELVYRISQAQFLELPITEQVYRILYQGQSAAVAIENLLAREPRAEH